MSALRLLDDVIELEGRPIAQLLPNLSPSLVGRLVWLLDDIADLEEDAATMASRIAELEDRIKELDTQFVRASR